MKDVTEYESFGQVKDEYFKWRLTKNKGDLTEKELSLLGDSYFKKLHSRITQLEKENSVLRRNLRFYKGINEI